MITEELENYEPKGDLIGFPKEIIARMLECQVEQGNPRNVTVFEEKMSAGMDIKGFAWDKTKEGWYFWGNVISNKNFNHFFNFNHYFEKYPKKQEYQELKNNKNMQENNKKDEDSQEFRVGDNVIDIILDLKGKITNVKSNGNLEIQFEGESCLIELSKIAKRTPLLHYRDDYDYDVIDFSNLPKRQESKRWRAEKEGIYYCVSLYPKSEGETGHNIDNNRWKDGNYFQTREEAQEVADKLNKYFQELVNPNK